MAIKYKRLTQKELDIFIQMRIHQLREEGVHIPQELRIRSRGTERHSASN